MHIISVEFYFFNFIYFLSFLDIKLLQAKLVFSKPLGMSLMTY